MLCAWILGRQQRTSTKYSKWWSRKYIRSEAVGIQYSVFRSQPHTSTLPPDVTALRILSRLSCTYSDRQHAHLRPCLRLYHQWRSSVWSCWGPCQHPLRDACRIHRLVRNFDVLMILLNVVFRAHCNKITGETERAWFRQRRWWSK